MRRLHRAGLALLTGLVLPCLPAHATIVINGVTQQSLSIVVDGTSNTIQFSEGATPSRITFCFDQVTSGIVDGTSNTIQFGEGLQLQVLGGDAGPYQPIASIVDGSSNTILLGEYMTNHFCLADVTVPVSPILDGTSNTIIIGENSGVDICFDNVRRGTITDGTSNTIVFGETEWGACYVGATVRTAASVAEPASLALLAAGLAGLGIVRRRRAIGGQRSEAKPDKFRK